jgi:hypothetical protein
MLPWVAEPPVLLADALVGALDTSTNPRSPAALATDLQSAVRNALTCANARTSAIVGTQLAQTRQRRDRPVEAVTDAAGSALRQVLAETMLPAVV